MPVQGGAVSLTDTNVDRNAMSDLEVELKAVESVPPMLADSLPEAATHGGDCQRARHFGTGVESLQHEQCH